MGTARLHRRRRRGARPDRRRPARLAGRRPRRRDDIVHIVDELVTNAVLHGTGPIRLRLRLHGRRLVGEVTDARPAVPPPAPDGVPVWNEAGRGLLLVAALATEYGTERHDGAGGGKTVWFSRLLTPGDGHRPAAAH
ncbi:hypothetical protein BJF79_45855 [Actinomadura sp. CNU-125]|uniref:ATP-binding protein n=1 Tax=Actinomadura sp. CNU-125 TaxID=1904961 RepID=UPI00095B5E5E|nr:ATP-binding protein [Actinomadura sp. CNU-125]OLT23637.1 hypothetical protein BJF79_45855 [Actinomadura sp. CNU-125]